MLFYEVHSLDQREVIDFFFLLLFTEVTIKQLRDKLKDCEEKIEATAEVNIWFPNGLVTMTCP